MDNFIDLVGLKDILESLPEELRAPNFEALYSKLHSNDPNSKEIREIELRVRSYFSDMQLPDEATIYDYLVLSLRPRDLIATFNWDPFLYQAWVRNSHLGNMPHITFLHGTVALGYDTEYRTSGPAGIISKRTYNTWEPTKLLYPVESKDYDSDEYIKSQWDLTENFLSDDATVRTTVFGYGAPKSDVGAMTLLNKFWGYSEQRVMEQFELIDIREEQQVKQSWDTFINTHHYNYGTDYFKSSLALNPRRTSESYFQHYQPFTPDEAFSASNPVPANFTTLEELWDWHKPLIEAEEKWKVSKK